MQATRVSVAMVVRSVGERCGIGRRRAGGRGLLLGLSRRQSRASKRRCRRSPAGRRPTSPTAMIAFKSGKRAGTIMDRIAKGFSDEEIRGDRALVCGTEIGGRAMRTSRREFLKAAGAAALLPMPALAQGAGPKVVVIGGGFAGASAARFVKQANRAITVTLVETNPTFTACPFSNGVIAGLRELRAQQFNYEKIADDRRDARVPARDRGRRAGAQRDAERRHASSPTTGS